MFLTLLHAPHMMKTLKDLQHLETSNSAQFWFISQLLFLSR